MASSGSRSLDVQPISVSPKLHPPPLFPELTFSYRHSKDGIDTNLLILLHGLGDTLEPFDRLAASLALPQTATLTIQGTLQVPLLEEKAFQWWHSFDDLGECELVALWPSGLILVVTPAFASDDSDSAS